MELKDITIKLNKSKIKAGDGKEKGEYPLFTCSPILNKFLDKYQYDDEAIIVGTGGNVVINYYKGKFNYSTDCLTIKTNEDFYTKYIYYFLIANKEKISKMFRGAGLKHLNKNEFFAIDIKEKNKKEQNEIIKTLDILNKIIENKNNELIKLDNIVKSQFVEMFGDPLLNDKKWKMVKLKDISSKITNGTTPKGGSKVYVDNGITFFRSQNVWRNEIRLEDVAHIDENTNKKMSNSCLKHNDILITKTGRINTENSSLGRAALYNGEDDKANINGHVYLVRLEHGISHTFILTILTSKEYRDYIRKVCVGGIDKRQLNQNHIEDFPIILPPIELQNQFAEIVKQIDKQKFVIEQQIKII